MARLPRQQHRLKVGWSLPENARLLLDDPALKTRDRIELVVFAYREDHGGNSPSISEIASVLGLPRANVQRGIDDLILLERAERIDGKLMIARSRCEELTRRLRR